jgi:hypothetical protein
LPISFKNLIEGNSAQAERAFVAPALSRSRLREKINLIIEEHPELRDATDVIAVQQGSQVKVATLFLDRVQANLKSGRER